MKLSFKCFPVGNLPYIDNDLPTKLTVKLFENVPFLAQLPNVNACDTPKYWTLEGIPGIKIQERKISFDEISAKLKSDVLALDIAYNNPTQELLEKYAFSSFFLPKYYQILERIKPEQTVANLYGPFGVAKILSESVDFQVLADKYYRKLIIQTITVKALWLINQIKLHSPNTIPVIVLEDNEFSMYGDMKRGNEDITRDVILNMYKKIFSKIKEAGAVVALQCFEKCDWKIPIEAGVDIISFNAYNYPDSLNIMAEHINEFLAQGGRINWAIVPTINEATIKALTLDYAQSKFTKAVEGLITAGVSERLAYNRAFVSIKGNLEKIPVLFAEKAVIIASQLSKKIPVIRN